MVKKRLLEAIESTDVQTKRWRSKFSAGKMAYDSGELRQAETLLTRAREMASGLPEASFTVNATDIGLAAVLLASKRAPQAKAQLEKAISNLESYRDNKHTELQCVARRFYAQALIDLKDERGAEKELLRSAEMLENLGIDACVQLSYTLSDLGGLYLAQGRISEAGQKIVKAMKILSAVVGPDTAEYTRADMIYASCNPLHAETRMEDAADGIGKMQYFYGANHPNVTRALNRYFKVLSDKGETAALAEAAERFGFDPKTGKSPSKHYHLGKTTMKKKSDKSKNPRQPARQPANTAKVAEHAEKLKRKDYEKQLLELQTELCHLQEWVKATGERIVIVFEGRDAAGKGGTIKALTERVSPRVFRLVALPAPSDREKSQMYVQRFIPHFPAAGEIVIFDRSWYNRAGVEHVMGFCTDKQYQRFLDLCPAFEQNIAENGIRIIKYWLEVSNDEQERRFKARIDDPLRQWKLSNMDLPSREKWYEFSRARDAMLEATDTKVSPWFIVNSNDKKRARLNIIAHLLSQIPYKPVKHAKVKLPDRSTKKKYDDTTPMRRRHWIPTVY